MTSPTHNLFVDDSGTKEYSEDRRYATTGGKTPYFVFAGLLLTPREAGAAARAMRGLKVSTFGTSNVEIKANWLRIGHERKACYLDKYGITDVGLTSLPKRCMT